MSQDEIREFPLGDSRTAVWVQGDEFWIGGGHDDDSSPIYSLEKDGDALIAAIQAARVGE